MSWGLQTAQPAKLYVDIGLGRPGCQWHVHVSRSSLNVVLDRAKFKEPKSWHRFNPGADLPGLIRVSCNGLDACETIWLFLFKPRLSVAQSRHPSN